MQSFWRNLYNSRFIQKRAPPLPSKNYKLLKKLLRKKRWRYAFKNSICDYYNIIYQPNMAKTNQKVSRTNTIKLYASLKGNACNHFGEIFTILNDLFRRQKKRFFFLFLIITRKFPDSWEENLGSQKNLN